jgi:hypothetical protein
MEPSTSAELMAELDALRAENARLRALLGLDAGPVGQVEEPVELLPVAPEPRDPGVRQIADRSSPRELKVALFRTLFAGRDDVYALRWANDRSGRSGWRPSVRGGWANARRADREYLPLTDEVVQRHLMGDVHVGLYLLLPGDACRLLVCDFDGAGWALDALAYRDAARAAGISAALERSRSGNGAHVWVFFSEPVHAASARRIGVHLLREAMTVRAELDLASYDRLFPAQDFMPKGSFGNLIALPLQRECRERGTTVFLDPATLQPYEDQWAYLSSIARLSAQAVQAIATGFGELALGPEALTFRRPPVTAATHEPPPTIAAHASAMLTIDRIGVPPALLAALKHLASLHNPEYYEKEKLRVAPRVRHDGGVRSAGFAVRVLDTDVRLHGCRFLLVEFGAAAILSAGLAVLVAAASVARGGNGIVEVAGVVFFVGVAINCAAVWLWVANRDADLGIAAQASLLDLGAFAITTLLPAALAIALHRSRQ